MSSVTHIKDFKGLENHVIKIVHEKCRTIVYDVWYSVIDWTPVCSGKAAASWRASPGMPKTKDLIPQPPWQHPSNCERIHDDPRNYITNADVLLGAYSRKFANWFIVNSAPYINDLNGGSSIKAPAGFIETAVDQALSKYR